MIQGEITFKIECSPGFDYARRKHTAKRRSDAVVFRPEGEGIHPMVLKASIPLHVKDGGVESTFTMKEGDKLYFLFSEDCRETESPSMSSYAVSGSRRRWSFGVDGQRSRGISGRWRETVNRSALTLKLMQDHRVRLLRRRAHLRPSGAPGR